MMHRMWRAFGDTGCQRRVWWVTPGLLFGRATEAGCKPTVDHKMMPMSKSAERSFVVTIVVSLTITACSRTAPATVNAAPPPRVISTDAAHIAKARADSARYPYTAADVHFMAGMIG